MSGVLTGFVVIGIIIAVGYLVGRIDLLGKHGQQVMARAIFFVLSPCLLFTVLAEAEVSRLFSPLLVVSLLAALSAFGVFLVVAVVIWRRKLPEATIGALASGYVNANNIGIPVSVYVLGDATYSAPVVLLQMLIFAPVALTLLDVGTGGSASVGRILTQPFRNPIIIGSLLGLLVSVTGITVPEPLFEPFKLIGTAALPLMLINFGMSLSGTKILQPGSGRRDVLLATSIKLAIMPVAAGLIGAAFGITGHELFAIVVLAALPTAQNVFNYAQRYSRGVILARDTVLLTTVGSVVVLLIASLLLT
ncbi:putative permease [Okibacterium sp. HSC-33S16]|uniref:AEC family transporter n=1 Tax=Okibacterium sp. HSC-33S16 TaxID=2910965 RepID=UPI00209D0194|nr:AEC family transporter [Okibacterium sp. HSC-33S16]MCP2031393.1 putative permease [Okibacterium sp. HSC-33S16]